MEKTIQARLTAMSKLVVCQEQSRRLYDFSHGRYACVTTIAQRLQEAMDDRGVDQSELARLIGVTQGTISLILLGKTRQSKHLPNIALELDVSYDWLIGRSPNKHEYALVDEPIFPSERALLKRLRSLPTLDRLALDRVTEAMFATQDLTRDISRFLPDERSLAGMFEGLLDAMPNEVDQEECARLLARWLPTGLAQLQDSQSKGDA